MQFAFSVIVEQVLGLGPDEPVTARILQDYSTFMKGLVSLPINIPGTPYARAVAVSTSSHSLPLFFFVWKKKDMNTSATPSWYTIPN